MKKLKHLITGLSLGLVLATITTAWAGLEDLTGTKFLDSLVVTNPTSSDPKNQGDDHIRGIKNVLVNTFPNLSGAVTATQNELNYVDIATLGTAAASKALTADGSANVNASALTWTDLGAVTTADVNGGTVDGAVIGGATPAAGTFTTLNTSGNVGIGVTPEAWAAAQTATQFSGVGALWGNTAQVAGASIYLTNNVYSDGTEKYIVTDEASQYYQRNGTHVFNVAGSGTADNAISWTTGLTINNSGQIIPGVSINLYDNKPEYYGNGADYWVIYNSTGTKYELHSTDVDGGGSDGTVFSVSDGTDDVYFTGKIIAAGIDSTPIGAGGAAAGYFTTLDATSIDNTPIGATIPSTGAFTTGAFSGAVTSSKSCGTGYSRYGTNECRKDTRSPTSLTAGSCTAITAPNASAVTLTLEGYAAAKSSNSALTRFASVQVFSDSGCTTALDGDDYLADAAAEETAGYPAAADKFLDVDIAQDTYTLPSAGATIYIKLTRDAGSYSLGSYYAVAYGD